MNAADETKFLSNFDSVILTPSTIYLCLSFSFLVKLAHLWKEHSTVALFSMKAWAAFVEIKNGALR